MPKQKNEQDQGALRKAVLDNDMDAFNRSLGGSNTTSNLLSTAIALGRSKMIVEMARQAKNEKQYIRLFANPAFYGVSSKLNILQFACLRCNAEAVAALVTAYSEVAKYEKYDQEPHFKSARSLLLESGINNEFGDPLLIILLDTISPHLLLNNLSGTKGVSNKRLLEIKKELLVWNEIHPEKDVNVQTEELPSNGSTSKSNSSLDQYAENTYDLGWNGPFEMIRYILGFIGDELANDNNLDMTDFRDLCNLKSSDALYTGTDVRDEEFWKIIVTNRMCGSRTSFESFKIDEETKLPVVTLKMKNKHGAAPIIVRLHYNIDSIAKHVSNLLDDIRSRKGLATKRSLENVKAGLAETTSNVTELKSQWEQTPEGMDAAIRKALNETPEFLVFYRGLYAKINRELKKVTVHDKEYFIKKNFTYQVVVSAISLAGETQGMLGNVAAATVNTGAHMLVSYKAGKQTEAVFNLSAAVHPEQLIAVSVAYELTKLLKDKIISGDVDIEKVKKAFISVITQLGKHKISADNNAFEHIAQLVYEKLDKRPSQSCTIS